MTIQINRNIYWSQLFVKQLAALGVKEVSISPGSRSTPLTYAFATNNDFKKYVNIDERSSAYFALGLAKQQRRPVAVVTTSGTAVAELYPAIIEAYNQRVPLIICTADRPHYLRNTGANQTINQDNIYSNHIRFFYDTGLPVIDEQNLTTFLNKITEGFYTGFKTDCGPVHFNFPFEKPFEPDSYTDKLPDDFFIPEIKFPSRRTAEPDKDVISKIAKAEKVIAVIGPNNFCKKTLLKIDKTFNEKNIPVFADSASGLRFLSDNNSIVNHTAFVRFENLLDLNKNNVVLLLGEAPVSNSILGFIEKTECTKISVNSFGDLKDPSRTVNHIIKSEENLFLDSISDSIKVKDLQFFEFVKSLEHKAEEVRTKNIEQADLKIESVVSHTLMKLIPDESNLFIGNSTIIRDFDLFSGKSNKNINVFSNRGTSGIEGNIATTLGVACKSSSPSFMVLGDLSFYYDSNSLLIAKQNKIPLTIIIINNNGGGIFSMLPISNQEEIFEKYFTTPLNLNLKYFADLYDGKYFNPNSVKELSKIFTTELDHSKLNIIEIKTDSAASAEFRKLYIKNIRQKLELNAD